MASEITPDGQVIAPRNITKPAPIFDLRGFQWRGLGTSSQPGNTDEEPAARRLLQTEQVVSLAAQAPVAAQKPLTLEAVAVPAPSAGPAPSVEPKRLPDLNQLGEQLGLETKEPLLPLPLSRFHGAYAGNGFNMIFVPTQFKTLTNEPKVGPNDNKLFIQLTTEQWTFGPTLGEIPNRGFHDQPDINLGGLPYLQTVQDVTNPLTGKGDKPATNKSGIHFEPGMFLHVPGSAANGGKPSVVRMASIPHGTTINAQGPVPPTPFTGGPHFSELDTTPFQIGNFKKKIKDTFHSMNAEQENILRVPKNLDKFNAKGTGTITTEIIKDPHRVLQKAIENQDIKETFVFKLHTGHIHGKPPAPEAPDFNGGGVANISFLHGPQNLVTDQSTSHPPGAADKPNAHAESMSNTWWVETVLYDVVVPPLQPFETATGLWATMPEVSVPGDTTGTKRQPSTAPTPRFAITAPAAGVKEQTTIKVPGIQLQYSQTINLNFGPPGLMLTWPHVSVATLVPVAPQPFQMK